MNNFLNKFVHNFRLVAVLTELKMFEEDKQGFDGKKPDLNTFYRIYWITCGW